MMQSNYLISCDWGTTSFRLYLVDAADGTIVQAVTEGLGIKELMAQWQRSAVPSRLEFFLEYLEFRISLLVKKARIDLKPLPVFISGMASSSIGMMELPYASLPFPLDGSRLVSRELQSGNSENSRFFLISGLCSQSDVMRGEESQLIGMADLFGTGTAVAILPGTHSKHAYLQDGQLIDFRTYMTGEFFALLHQHSILRNSLSSGTTAGEIDEPHFRQGVETGMSENVLSASFRVRTNELLHQFKPVENFHFLSGLLIGNELKDISPEASIYLCGGGRLEVPYAMALDMIGHYSFQVIAPEKVDAAVAKAHALIYRRMYP